MSWILYLRDLAPSATTVTTASFSNGASTVQGYDNMIGVLANSCYVELTFAFAVTVGAIGLANHNLTTSATIVLWRWTGSTYSQVGTTKSPSASYVDQVIEFGGSTSATKWKVEFVTNVAGKKIGSISFLSNLGYHKITLTNAVPRYPIGLTFKDQIARQKAATGEIIGQKYGGSYFEFQLEIPYVTTRDTTSGQEGMLDDAFLYELDRATGAAMGTQGFPGAIWVKDDDDLYQHCTVQGFIGPVTHAGGRSTITLALATIPHEGLV